VDIYKSDSSHEYNDDIPEMVSSTGVALDKTKHDVFVRSDEQTDPPQWKEQDTETKRRKMPTIFPSIQEELKRIHHED